MHICQITPADIEKFIGGRLLSQNPDPEVQYTFRGRIENIYLGGRKKPVLHATFTSVESADDCMAPKSWSDENPFNYSAELDFYFITEFTSSRLVVHSVVTGETITLLSPDAILDLTAETPNRVLVDA